MKMNVNRNITKALWQFCYKLIHDCMYKIFNEIGIFIIETFKANTLFNIFLTG